MHTLTRRCIKAWGALWWLVLVRSHPLSNFLVPAFNVCEAIGLPLVQRSASTSLFAQIDALDVRRTCNPCNTEKAQPFLAGHRVMLVAIPDYLLRRTSVDKLHPSTASTDFVGGRWW